MRSEAEKVLNSLLVDLFKDILKIEQGALRDGKFLDLSLTEMHIIEAIGIEGNRTMSEVAASLNITVGTLTTAINKLIAKGYVERKRIEEDRRVVLIKNTDKGQLAYKTHETFHNQMVKDVLDGLNKEDEVILIGALKNLTNFFEIRYGLSK